MDAEDDRTQIDPRANPWAMLAALPLFSGLPKDVVDAAVTELEWKSLPGGGLLFEAGAPADAVYFVVSGCLRRLWTGRRAHRPHRRRRDESGNRPDHLEAAHGHGSRAARLGARHALGGHFRARAPRSPGAILRLARLTVLRLEDREGRAPAHR